MKRTIRYHNAITSLAGLVMILVLLTGSIQAEVTKYTCPMHPHYISDTFGSCPICGMDLVEVEAGTIDSASEEEHGLHLSTQMIQHTGVRSKAAETAHFGRSIRSFGEVVVNQRLQTDISLREEGWIEKLIVNAEGDEVEHDTLLFKFYSPQLVAVQQDYLAALSAGNSGRIRVTEDRLRSLGIQDRVVKEISRGRAVIRSLPYYAGQKGRVENILIRQGGYMRPGTIAMRIQGYEKVWIQVNLAEQDIGFVKSDSRVNVEFPSLGMEREGVVIDYIAPSVDPATRTAQVRLVLDNPDGSIRPGSYVNVAIMTEISPRLAIPTESILQNKEGNYVILEREDGTFQAREIKTGLQYKGLTEVQAGLREGEKVLVSGQFLIDSESSLRESFRRMEKLALSLAEQEVSDEQLVLLNHMVEGALYLHEELAAGSHPKPEMLDAAEQAARKLQHELQGSRLIYMVDDFLDALNGRAEIMIISGWRDLLAKSTAALLPWMNEGRPDYYKELGLTVYVTKDSRSWVQFTGDVLSPFGEVEAHETPLGEYPGGVRGVHKEELNGH